MSCFIIQTIYFLFSFFISINSHTITIPSACNNLRDGLHYIRPSPTGVVIPVICSNGFSMIDLSLNFDAISTYLNSPQLYNSTNHIIPEIGYKYGHVYGTACNDFNGWHDFWLPATKNTKFRVAKKCMECALTPIYPDSTAYFMTNYYVCNNKIFENICERDSNGDPISYKFDSSNKKTSMCNICDINKLSTNGSGDDSWNDCIALQLNANTKTDSDHDKCAESGAIIVRPAVADDRSQCTCYKPADDEVSYSNVTMDRLPKVMNGVKHTLVVDNKYYIDSNIVWARKIHKIIKNCTQNKVYLSSADFLSGTYIIDECGEYIFTEDVQMNPNAPSAEDMVSGWSPNALHPRDLYWYPSARQLVDGIYPGSDVFHGPYQFGFFTGITIQSSNVIINLNGFSFGMDPVFYLQQRIFSIIEIGDRPFVVYQGPADFGRSQFVSVENIVIKDGTLDLSSHQAIHGANSRFITISNLIVKNFDVSGIQLNGCIGVVIENSVVGPQNQNIPVLGRYLHARALIPRLKYFYDKHSTEVVPFGNGNPHKKDITVKGLINNFIEMMDMIYFNVLDGKQYEGIVWETAKKIFINEDGWMDGGSSYGVILNGVGTAVIAFGRRKVGSEDIRMKNVEIYGIGNKAIEKFWTAKADRKQMQGFFFDTIDWHAITHSKDGRYIGDPYTDIVFAANELMKDEFCFLNTLFVATVRDWVFDDDQTIEVDIQCGSDIQSHDAKGSMGLRIDGVQKFSLSDLYIHDISSWGELGSDACGEWKLVEFLTACEIDIEPGYTGTRAHGIVIDFALGSIKNVRIKNIESKYGSAIGMSVYKGSDISSMSNISVSGVHAGTALTSKMVNKLKLPNHVPYACSVQLGPNTDGKHMTVMKKIEYESISGEHIYGYEICADEELIGTQIASVLSFDRRAFVEIGNFFVDDENRMYYLICSGLILFVFTFAKMVVDNYYCCWRNKRQKNGVMEEILENEKLLSNSRKYQFYGL